VTEWRKLSEIKPKRTIRAVGKGWPYARVVIDIADYRALMAGARRLEAMATVLMEKLCDCAPRADDYEPQLSVTPGTHDWSCAYRKAMQPLLEAGRD